MFFFAQVIELTSPIITAATGEVFVILHYSELIELCCIKFVITKYAKKVSLTR
jgi:hypothetical protein